MLCTYLVRTISRRCFLSIPCSSTESSLYYPIINRRTVHSSFPQRIQLKQIVRQEKSHQRETGEQIRDKARMRRAYVLGGSLIFIWLSTHAILLYRRRGEYWALNEKLPPIPFEEFAAKYLLTGQVKTIVYQPHFEVGNVYLHSATEQQMKRAVIDWFHVTPDKFTRPPDVRFHFEGDAKAVSVAVATVQKSAVDAGDELQPIELSIDQFPSYRELSFIMASTLFTLAAVSLMK